MKSMQAQVGNIALSASRILLNPVVLTILVVGALALVTGLVARVVVLVEDLHISRIHRRNR
jgi:hypothetical protein